MSRKNNERHEPVMVAEVLESIPKTAKLIVDGTLGHAGHMQAVLEQQTQFPNLETIIGIDRDPVMLTKAKTHLQPYEKQIRIETVQGSYAQLESILQGRKSDFILLDLGVNMEHFKDGSRGFSLKAEGDLDMRFDRTGGKPLKEYLEKWKSKELEEMLISYADMREGNAKKLARQIIEYREKNPIRDTTHALVQFLKTQGYGEHFIAVLFQAFRIATNQELDHLKEFLEKGYSYLTPGGRCGILSYHSGEDRMVKYAFREWEDKQEGIILTKKVILPHYQEVQKNKAARSAKWRVFERKK